MLNMPLPVTSRVVGASADEDAIASAATDQLTDPSSSERQSVSVSELVRNYSDPPEGQKRDRSESGDAAPAGKRGARERGGVPGRSPSSQTDRTFKECLETAIGDL